MKKQIDDLPEHGQHIFKKTRESALKRYKDPSKRRSKSDTPEEVAHKVAWSAVKKKYKKSGSKWVSKNKKKTK
jgi:cation transport regulator